MALAAWINPEYLGERKIALLRRRYAHAKPFPHLALPSFLRPARLRQLERAVRRQPFTRKESDLFKLEQTRDLVGSRDPVIAQFAALLCSREFAQYMTAITGARIKPGSIDMAGVIYRDTDYLLVHDDEVEGRRIAYILNLSRGFTKKSGGALALLDHDANGKPRRIVKRIPPAYGTLSFFTVSDRSYHQVEEVLEHKERLTIGGWLHG